MFQTQQNNSSSSNRTMVPEAKQALNNMKFEIANELGINLKQGYNGDLPSRQAGYIGGYMVKRLIENAERSMAGGSQQQYSDFTSGDGCVTQPSLFVFAAGKARAGSERNAIRKAVLSSYELLSPDWHFRKH